MPIVDSLCFCFCLCFPSSQLSDPLSALRMVFPHCCRSDGEAQAMSFTIGSLCRGVCFSWLEKEITWLFYTGSLVSTQLNFWQLIPTLRVQDNYKACKKHVLYWGEEVLNHGPNIDFLCETDINFRAECCRHGFCSLCIASVMKTSQGKRSQGFLHCRRNPWPLYW